ncbi:MAG: hypothetical protein EA427_13485 [Spirochaetaceae bacterium]|nr:MAG: hypothetical protein EA427_13485 [Spirochaetaceae bacterium]
MRTKIILLAVLLVVLPGLMSLSAQDGGIPDLATFSESFEDFSSEFAKSLPMNSAIGLNWSDAYIGQLLPIPSFGVGITTGFTTIPLGVLEDLVDDLGLDSGSALGDLPGIGAPLPGYALDARVGGFYLPFDAGIKFGTIPEMKIGDVSVEYTNFGFDVRYAVLEGGLVLPKISVGAGYNHLRGSVSAPLGIGNTRIASVPDPEDENNTYVLALTDPNVDFDWTANVLDFKVQVSKRFIVVEPHIGLGASYGWAKTNSGFDTQVTVFESDGVTESAISASELGKIAGVSIDDKGLSISTEENPFAIRAFGGASLNVAVFRLDLGAMYNLNSGAFGATLGARFQL